MFAQDLLANQRRDNTTLALRYTEHNFQAPAVNLIWFYSPQDLYFCLWNVNCLLAKLILNQWAC